MDRWFTRRVQGAVGTPRRRAVTLLPGPGGRLVGSQDRLLLGSGDREVQVPHGDSAVSRESVTGLGAAIRFRIRGTRSRDVRRSLPNLDHLGPVDSRTPAGHGDL